MTRCWISTPSPPGGFGAAVAAVAADAWSDAAWPSDASRERERSHRGRLSKSLAIEAAASSASSLAFRRGEKEPIVEPEEAAAEEAPAEEAPAEEAPKEDRGPVATEELEPRVPTAEPTDGPKDEKPAATEEEPTEASAEERREVTGVKPTEAQAEAPTEEGGEPMGPMEATAGAGPTVEPAEAPTVEGPAGTGEGKPAEAPPTEVEEEWPAIAGLPAATGRGGGQSGRNHWDEEEAEKEAERVEVDALAGVPASARAATGAGWAGGGCSWCGGAAVLEGAAPCCADAAPHAPLPPPSTPRASPRAALGVAPGASDAAHGSVVRQASERRMWSADGRLGVGRARVAADDDDAAAAASASASAAAAAAAAAATAATAAPAVFVGAPWSWWCPSGANARLKSGVAPGSGTDACSLGSLLLDEPWDEPCSCCAARRKDAGGHDDDDDGYGGGGGGGGGGCGAAGAASETVGTATRAIRAIASPSSLMTSSSASIPAAWEARSLRSQLGFSGLPPRKANGVSESDVAGLCAAAADGLRQPADPPPCPAPGWC